MDGITFSSFALGNQKTFDAIVVIWLPRNFRFECKNIKSLLQKWTNLDNYQCMDYFEEQAIVAPMEMAFVGVVMEAGSWYNTPFGLHLTFTCPSTSSLSQTINVSMIVFPYWFRFLSLCFEDVDTEHAYIMEKALHSYQTYQNDDKNSETASAKSEISPCVRPLPKRPRAQSATCRLPSGTKVLPQKPLKFLKSGHPKKQTKVYPHPQHCIGLAGLGPKVCSETAISEVGKINSASSMGSLVATEDR